MIFWLNFQPVDLIFAVFFFVVAVFFYLAHVIVNFTAKILIFAYNPPVASFILVVKLLFSKMLRAIVETLRTMGNASRILIFPLLHAALFCMRHRLNPA